MKLWSVGFGRMGSNMAERLNGASHFVLKRTTLLIIEYKSLRASAIAVGTTKVFIKLIQPLIYLPF